MNKTLKTLINIPIIVVGYILIILGTLGIGYSFVTLVLNHNYVESNATIVEKAKENGDKYVVIEYKANDETFNGTLPFIDKYVGKKIVIGYNPENPIRFNLGSQNAHFSILLWGIFFEMLGILITTIQRKLKD